MWTGIGLGLLWLVLLSGGLQPPAPEAGKKTLLTIEPTRGNPRNSEGDIVELTDGRLCLIYSRFTGGGDDDAAADLALRTSSNGGMTWSRSEVIEADPAGWYCYTSITFAQDRMLLAYCAGDRKIGGLNRLKVLALSRDWLASHFPAR